VKKTGGTVAQGEELEGLVRAVSRSTKYKHVSQDLIRRIGSRELMKRRSITEAIKATKTKIHQVGGAYFLSSPDIGRSLERLRRAAASGDPGDLRQICRELMSVHASTKERLEILDEFYTTTLAGLPQIRTIIDLACGLNPLAWPWLPLGDEVEYYAYDVYADLIDMVQGFMEIVGIKGRAEIRDVIGDPPTQQVDLALILKTLPCLAQVDDTAVPHLLDVLRARYLLVSFPVRSLGGRSKGMVQNYEAQFHTWAAGRDWKIERFQFSSELVFLARTD
jgi:16S rRNA (guanine(1405)-N(7))-methyltransferase